MDIKWLIYGAGALGLLCLSAFSSNRRRFWFVVFLLCLQLNLSWYVIVPYGSYVGVSGPTGIVIPLLVLVGTLVLLQRAFAQGEGRISFGKEIAIPFGGLFLTTVMTLAWTPERWLVLYAVSAFLESYLMFLVGLNVVRRREDANLVLKLLVVIVATQSLIYFIQNATGTTFSMTGEVISRSGSLQRHGGTVSANSKGFSMFITPLLLVAVAWLLTGVGRLSFRRVLVVLMGTAALILTFTRASWAGFVIGVVWISLVGGFSRLARDKRAPQEKQSQSLSMPPTWRPRPALATTAAVVMQGARHQPQRRLVSPPRILGLVLIALIPLVFLWPKIQMRLNDDVRGDYDSRAVLMHIAWSVIQDNPILGVGAGAYSHVFRRYLDARSRGRWLYVVHNAYLLRWAETGILGLFFFVWFLLTAFYHAARGSRSPDPAIAALMLGWSAGLLSLTWELWWDIWLGLQAQLMLFFMLGVSIACRRLHAAETARVPVRQVRISPRLAS